MQVVTGNFTLSGNSFYVAAYLDSTDHFCLLFGKSAVPLVAGKLDAVTAIELRKVLRFLDGLAGVSCFEVKA